MISSKWIYLLLIFACIALVVKAQTNQQLRRFPAFQSQDKTKDILLHDQNTLDKNIDQKMKLDPAWENIRDYSLPVRTLVNQANAQKYFDLSRQSIKNLSLCLKKDFCGMERANEDDAYFDETKTPGHILLGRSLEIIEASLEEKPELASLVDWENMENLTNNANEKIQVLALKLLRQYHQSEGEDERWLKIADHYTGRSKALALVDLSRSLSNHQALLKVLSSTFAADDPHTTISVIEKLSSMNLSGREIEMLANYLCHYKDQEGQAHNWKMIKYLMKKNGVQMELVCP